MSDIFLSYAREDLWRVKPVVAALEERGWRVWWDRTIMPGQIIEHVIEAALDDAQCVIVLWSRKSVKSEWVTDEARDGRDKGKLIPALLDEVAMPLGFRSRHAANLVGWSGALPQAGFEELARAVEAILEVSAARPVKASAAAAPSGILQPAPAPDPAPGETRVNPKDGLTYVWIPPGKFMMGCSPGDSEALVQEKPPHEVTITRGFWLGQTPVTQEAYQRVIGSNPSYFKGARQPVENVSWNEAQAYCKAIGMRLPTEAEWEYAARAGSAGARYDNLDQIAWYSGNSGRKTHEVGRKQANAFGLYDMLGNVWEWVGDWYGAYGEAAAVDPGGPSSGQDRVLRGGSWDDNPRYVRASDRSGSEPTVRGYNVGFRCAGELG